MLGKDELPAVEAPRPCVDTGAVEPAALVATLAVAAGAMMAVAVAEKTPAESISEESGVELSIGKAISVWFANK